MTDTNTGDLSITTRGDVTERDENYARDKLMVLLRQVGSAVTPVLHAEVRLVREPDPARDRPSIAEAVFDVNGQPVRAQVAAHDMTEAVDLLEDRLRRRLERHAHVRDDRRDRVREPDELYEHEEHPWVHGELPAQRREYFDRPIDERQLVRRKSFAPSAMTPDEAADALDLLAHDFFLFTNLITGADAVVSYVDDNTLELADLSGRDDALGSDTVTPMRISRLEPPRSTVAEAIEQLDIGLTPFVFFEDASTDRGSVAYHRYDGHYGLVTLT